MNTLCLRICKDLYSPRLAKFLSALPDYSRLERLSSKQKSLLGTKLPHLTLGVYLPMESKVLYALSFSSMAVLICSTGNVMAAGYVAQSPALHDKVLHRSMPGN